MIEISIIYCERQNNALNSITKILEKSSFQTLIKLQIDLLKCFFFGTFLLSLADVVVEIIIYNRSEKSMKTIVFSYNSLSTIQNKNLYATLSFPIECIAYQTIIVSHDGGYVSTDAHVFFLFRIKWITH